MIGKLHRRKCRKQQLKINNQIKKTYYRHLIMHPCCYCKKVFLVSNLTVEHIIPLSFGGSNHRENIDLACAPCNQQRGRESWFLKRQILQSHYSKTN